MNAKKITDLWESFKKWFYFRFRNPRLKVVEIGGFKFDFRTFWLDITNASDMFRIRLRVDMKAYGYLYAAARQGYNEQLQGFAYYIAHVLALLVEEQTFGDDLCAAIDGYYARAMKRAEANVAKSRKKSEEEQQNEENLHTEVLKEIERYAHMSDKERKAYKKEYAEAFRDVVSTPENKKK
jgi:hypothetical protein